MWHSINSHLLKQTAVTVRMMVKTMETSPVMMPLAIRAMFNLGRCGSVQAVEKKQHDFRLITSSLP